jgi:hypothetical protein
MTEDEHGATSVVAGAVRLRALVRCGVTSTETD